MNAFTKGHLQIRLDNLAHNYHALCTCLKKGTTPAAVVKNNAYGLGDVAVSERLYKEGCRCFFVAHAHEGKRVRKVAPEAQIYVLQGIGSDNVQDIQSADLIPVIDTWAQWEFFKNCALDIRPAIQVETGLNRLGFSHVDVMKLSENERDSFCLVLSHLACADDPNHMMNARQIERFKEFLPYFKRAQFSLSASDGVFLGDDFHFDVARLGATLYGLNPFHPKYWNGIQTPPYERLKSLGLKTPLHVTAPVLQVAHVDKGESIGYGGTTVANKDMKIATVSIGYGDGLFRSFGARGCVWIKGQKAPLIGRVSMDNIMCDVSAIDNVKSGDFADILNNVYTPDDMAIDAGTIGYEVLGSLAKGERFCKSYID